jgi:Flp pilus assembly protein TadD
MERGEWGKAAALFKAVIRVKPQNVPSHGNLGLCHAQLGHKTDALAALDKALELDP